MERNQNSVVRIQNPVVRKSVERVSVHVLSDSLEGVPLRSKSPDDQIDSKRRGFFLYYSLSSATFPVTFLLER